MYDKFMFFTTMYDKFMFFTLFLFVAKIKQNLSTFFITLTQKKRENLIKSPPISPKSALFYLFCNF